MLISTVIAGATPLTIGPVAMASGPPEVARHTTPASLSAKQIRELVEFSTAPHSTRIGWFLPVACHCSFVNEATFQKIMDGIFHVAGRINGRSVRSTPFTAMKVQRNLGRSRIPDIYYFKLNQAHPTRGVGAINEFKVGTLAMGSKEFQSKQDALMLRNRHGYGANASNRGEFLPVTTAIWWFAPRHGITFSDSPFIQSLLARGIDVVYIIDNPNAMIWPRSEGKRRKAKDIKEIETNNSTRAQDGLDDMIGPCLQVCPKP